MTAATRIRPRKKSQTSRTAESAPSDRRQQILQALARCISGQGYSKTSLTDIAVAAKMSPSHIRYYFVGKEAMLKAYLEQTCEGILQEIRAIGTSDADAWLEAFTRFFVGNPRISPVRLKVMVEIFGISTHDPELSRIKSAYDAEIRGILEAYFQGAGCAAGLTPASAAEIAQALEAGLKYNAAFQEAFDAEKARESFLASIRLLRGE
jgi:AcrR family transcriptional regulator